jgi:hypothetical protein
LVSNRRIKLSQIEVKGFAGTIEERLSWKRTDSKASEGIGKFMETDGSSPWLEVRTEYWRYDFRQKNYNIISDGVNDDCDTGLGNAYTKPYKRS